MAQSHHLSYSLAASWKKGEMLRKPNSGLSPQSPEYPILLTAQGLSVIIE